MADVAITAPFAGTVIAIAHAASEPVRAGAAVVVLEAMKMEHEVIAESDDAGAFIEELVTLTDFRLLLTSRERPGWLAARKVVYGEATLIEMDALAFTAMAVVVTSSV